MEEVIAQAPGVEAGLGSETMLAPQEVQRMLALRALGWGAKRISAELGCSRNTVREYLRRGGWKPMDVSRRASVVEPHREWLAERLRQHRGNADVVRQDLKRELGIAVSLRTVQRAVEPLRRALRAEVLATVRFETAPGQQGQFDAPAGAFGEAPLRGDAGLRPPLLRGRVPARAPVGVAAGPGRHLPPLRRRAARAAADNAKALVDDHNRQTREVKFNDRFHAFCRCWDVIPRACAPYRARTKGKDERGVGYVKRNAIAGHRFASVDELHAHLDCWMREVADVRVHGTTGEPPLAHFERDEAAALNPLPSKAPFLQVRELARRTPDACIEPDNNFACRGSSARHRVPSPSARSVLTPGRRACHAQSPLRRAASSTTPPRASSAEAAPACSCRRTPPAPAPVPAELLRPLEQYEAPGRAAGDAARKTVDRGRPVRRC
jgi:transposase